MRSMRYLFFKTIFLLILISLSITIDEKVENYYDILGVSKDATITDIKRAFKKLTLKYHPDKNKENKEAAKAKFVKIANAYEVLSDPEKRKEYDEELKGNRNFKDFGFGQGDFKFNDFQDIFDHFFKDFKKQSRSSKGKKGKGDFEDFDFQKSSEKGKKDKGEFEDDDESENDPKRENLFEDTDVILLSFENISDFYKRKENWIILLFEVEQLSDIEFEEFNIYLGLFEKLASRVKNDLSNKIIKIGAVDCDYEKEICEEIYDASNNKLNTEYIKLPAIILFDHEIGNIYYGKRDSLEILKHAYNMIPNFIQYLDTNNYYEIINNEFDITPVILLKQKQNKEDFIELDIFYRYIAFKYTYVKNEQNIMFYESDDERLNSKYLKVNRYPNVVVINDPVYFKSINFFTDDVKGSDDLSGNKFNFTKIESFIKKEHKSVKRNLNKIKIFEFNPLSKIKKKNCNCSEPNSFCGIFINYSDLEDTNKLSKIKKKFLQNLSIVNQEVKFCYINEAQIDDLIDYLGEENGKIFQIETAKLRYLFFLRIPAKAQKTELFIYKDHFNFIKIVEFIDEIKSGKVSSEIGVNKKSDL